MAQPTVLHSPQRSPLAIPAVIVASLIGVILFVKLHGPPAQYVPEGRAIASIDLFFEDRDDGAVVRLYERWLKTGSGRLAEELGARGLVPARGAGGVY